MSVVKSFSVGNGDLFYIKHNSDNFTIIDCCLSDENCDDILDELESESYGKGVTRFISTHPDQDHISGVKRIDDRLGIRNFYCVKNSVKKEEVTDDFKHYCKIRDDSGKTYHIGRGRSRRWLNDSCNERGSSGLNFLWPIVGDEEFKNALAAAENGESPNNISAVIRYSIENSASMLWMGDLETEFLERIAHKFSWPKTNILFAPHHGRKSGRVPKAILDKIKPDLVIIGEAPAEDLNYYSGHNVITQNSAGDITFECDGKMVRIFVANEEYFLDFLEYKPSDNSAVRGSYIGTLTV